MKPTKDKLNHCWSVKVAGIPSNVQEKLMDWVDSKMDRGYRLRHTIEGNSIVVSHNDFEYIRPALRFLKTFSIEEPKKEW